MIMLMVNALAGTGKTTTGCWGLGAKVPKGVKCSDEQKAIIRIMRGYRGSKAACAFNKSIADELQDRVPQGCVAATANAFGHRAWRDHIESNPEVDGLKVSKICRGIMDDKYQYVSWAEKMRIQSAVNHLVNLCKSYLFDPTVEEKCIIDVGVEGDGVTALRWLAMRFDIDIDDSIIDISKETFIKSVEHKTWIDYNDQIFMPLYYGIELPVFGHMLADEVQDLNRAKQELVFRMAEEITAIGDINQAIYGFSGADSEAMPNMSKRMELYDDKELHSLPLNISRRCPKSVVRLANTIVPEFKAREDAPEGSITRMDEEEFLDGLGKEPCMIVCRTNAPLTGLAFKLLRQNIRCFIQGRDVGSGLKEEIRRSGSNDLRVAVKFCLANIDRKKMDIHNSQYPDMAKIESLQDKQECIEFIADQADTVKEFEQRVDSLFKESGGKNDIRLSSVHKAKGLEHEKVVIYHNELLGRGGKGFQAQQEKNLEYVAYTRSMDSLVRVFCADRRKGW